MDAVVTAPDEAPAPADMAAEIRRRQQARALVTALLLFAFVLLVYGISIARMMG